MKKKPRFPRISAFSVLQVSLFPSRGLSESFVLFLVFVSLHWYRSIIYCFSILILVLINQTTFGQNPWNRIRSFSLNFHPLKTQIKTGLFGRELNCVINWSSFALSTYNFKSVLLCYQTDHPFVFYFYSFVVWKIMTGGGAMSLLSKLRCITVDVTGTLIAYKGELGDYYCMAAKAIGLPCPDYKRVHEGFKLAYTDMARKYPCFGFSAKIPNVVWWKTVVRDSFVKVIYANLILYFFSC